MPNLVQNEIALQYKIQIKSLKKIQTDIDGYVNMNNEEAVQLLNEFSYLTSRFADGLLLSISKKDT